MVIRRVVALTPQSTVISTDLLTYILKIQSLLYAAKLIREAFLFIVNQLSLFCCLFSWPFTHLHVLVSPRSLHRKSTTLVSVASGQNSFWPWAEICKEPVLFQIVPSPHTCGLCF